MLNSKKALLASCAILLAFDSSYAAQRGRKKPSETNKNIFEFNANGKIEEYIPTAFRKFKLTESYKAQRQSLHKYSGGLDSMTERDRIFGIKLIDNISTSSSGNATAAKISKDNFISCVDSAWETAEQEVLRKQEAARAKNEKAATKIQAAFRGKKGRDAAELQKLETDFLNAAANHATENAQEVLRKQEAARATKEKAATKIQAFARGNAARTQAAELRHEKAAYETQRHERLQAARLRLERAQAKVQDKFKAQRAQRKAESLRTPDLADMPQTPERPTIQDFISPADNPRDARNHNSGATSSSPVRRFNFSEQAQQEAKRHERAQAAESRLINTESSRSAGTTHTPGRPTTQNFSSPADNPREARNHNLGVTPLSPVRSLNISEQAQREAKRQECAQAAELRSRRAAFDAAIAQASSSANSASFDAQSTASSDSSDSISTINTVDLARWASRSGSNQTKKFGTKAADDMSQVSKTAELPSRVAAFDTAIASASTPTAQTANTPGTADLSSTAQLASTTQADEAAVRAAADAANMFEQAEREAEVEAARSFANELDEAYNANDESDEAARSFANELDEAYNTNDESDEAARNFANELDEAYNANDESDEAARSFANELDEAYNANDELDEAARNFANELDEAYNAQVKNETALKEKQEAENLAKAIAESKKTLHNNIQKLVATEISEDLALEINNAKVSNEEIAAQLNPTAALSAARGEVTGSVANALDQAAARTAMAAGAGDNNIEYGVWAQANLGRAKQKTLKGVNGYKSLSKGATIGLDAKLNDKDMIGMSVSINNNDIKVNKATKGNKLKVDSYQLVAYGSHKTDNQFVVSGFVNGGINEVNSVSVRSLNNPIKAKAKYKIYNTGLGLKLGKIFNIAESTTLTPDVGVEYAKLFQKSYTEKNAGITTQHVSSNESDYTRVSAGAKLSRRFALDSATVTPELHARAFRDMSHGTDKFTARFEGMNATTVKGAKAAKEGYNLGTSVTVVSGKMDFSVNYDATFKKKYERHEGSMKVKINL